jgi:RimJ/RimL family protein N-acetyltransferase
MNIHFRLLLASDSSEYRSVRLECLRTFPDNFGTAWEEENRQKELKFEKLLKSEDKDSFMMGAFDSERLIGLCGFHREDRMKTRHRGEIVQMYIHKDYTDQHIGSRLLKATIENALLNPGIEQINLSVVYQNERANAVYDHLGFKEYGRMKHYFKSGDRYWDQRFMILYKEGFKP